MSTAASIGTGIWLLLALEIWHRLFVDEDGSEAVVAGQG